MRAVRKNSITILLLVSLIILGTLCARHERKIPITFDQPIETFSYGPLSGSIRQTILSPESYLSRVSVHLRANGIPATGYPLNLRLRRHDGLLVAETRQPVYNNTGMTAYALDFPPLPNSSGQFFELEIQPAQGAEGDIYLPIRSVSPSQLRFSTMEGRPRHDWSTNHQLYQTVRPLTFIRQLFRLDPIVSLGLFSFYFLATTFVSVCINSVAGWRGIFWRQINNWLFSSALILISGWAIWALIPL